MLSPLAVAVVEASYGVVPSRSTKISADEVAPIHCLTVRTNESCCVFVIVQVTTPRCCAGDVTGNGPPLYAWRPCSSPHEIVAWYPAGTVVSPTVTGVETG